MTTESPTRPSSPRDRFRAQVRADAKAAALRQLAAGGIAAVSVNAIAKELGVSGPALYRYFAGRDDLLDQLVVDAYDDLAAAARVALAAADDDGKGDGLTAFALAYRAWARAEPHRYRLLFGQPAAGHDGHAQPLVEAAQRLMELLLTAVEPDAAAEEPGAALTANLVAWADAHGSTTDPAHALAAITAWARLHGWARLEIDGNFRSMEIDPELLPVGL